MALDLISKKCTKCGIEKSVVNFYSDKRRKDRLFSACKNCHNKLTAEYACLHKNRKQETNRLWQAANPEKRRAAYLRRYLRTDAVTPETKCCCKCRLSLSVSEFHIKKDASDGLYPRCKACRSQGGRELRKLNIDSYREYDRVRYYADPSRRNRNEWYLANKGKSLERSTSYAKSHPDVIRLNKKNTLWCMVTIRRTLKKPFLSGETPKKFNHFISSEIEEPN